MSDTIAIGASELPSSKPRAMRRFTAQPKIKAPKKICGRSSITNGKRLLAPGAGHTIWGRRFADLCADHAQDLGGVDNLSEAEIGLLRRASAIECELERREAMLAAGEEVNLDEFARAASHCRRLWETLGVSRKPKIKEVTLGDIVARHSKKAAEAVQSEAKPIAAVTAQPAPVSPTSEPRVDASPVIEPVNSAAIDAGHAVAPAEEAA